MTADTASDQPPDRLCPDCGLPEVVLHAAMHDGELVEHVQQTHSVDCPRLIAMRGQLERRTACP